MNPKDISGASANFRRSPATEFVRLGADGNIYKEHLEKELPEYESFLASNSPSPDTSNEINILGLDNYYTEIRGNTIYLNPRWIKCSDRMPEKDSFVLALDEKKNMVVAEVSGYNSWYCACKFCDGSYFLPTHWMPLPETPNE